MSLQLFAATARQEIEKKGKEKVGRRTKEK